MSKKILSVVLALALALSCFAVGASAVGGLGYESEEDAAYYQQTWALDEPVQSGNTYTVNVRLTANYSVGTIEFAVQKVVSNGTLTLSNVALGEAIPETWGASAVWNDANGKVMIVPNPADDAAPGIDNPNNAIIAVLTYTASADVAATLRINVEDAKSKTNPGGTLFAARMSDSNVVTGTPIVGQTVNATNTVTIGSAAPVEYTVSFDKNGGAGSMADVVLEEGSTYTLPSCGFTAPTGKQFAGWEVNGVTKAVGDKITVDADTTVKALWSTIMYTVSFAAGNGTGTMADKSVAYGSTYALPACEFAAPAGYEFSAWSVNGAEKAVGDTITVTSNVVVTAVWVKSIVPPTLVAIADTLGVVDTSRTMLDEQDIDGDGDLQVIDGYLLGFDPDNNGSITELFTVEGDGEMQIVATEAGSEAATGTIVNVVDLEGNVVATYVVIVFGDVNGDGFADGTDASIIVEHDAWMLGDWGRLYSFQEFAGDTNVDYGCDGTDASIIVEHDAWMLGDLGRIDVAGILATLGF